MTAKRKGKAKSVIRLEANRIILSGFAWTASPAVFQQLLDAGATSIGQATKATPAAITFGTPKQAKDVFQAAFACEPAWETFVESINIYARWEDAVGLGELAKKVVME